MMSLYLFEIKKCFQKKSVFILIFIMLIANGYKIFDNYDFYWTQRGLLWYEDDEYVETLDSVSGKITDETATRIINGREAFFEGMFDEEIEYSKENDAFVNIYYSYKYQYEYSTLIAEDIEKAKDNIDFFKERDNIYESKKYELFASLYDGRFIDDFYDGKCFSVLFSYNFSSLLAIIILFAIIPQIFMIERESGVDPIMLATKNGKSICTTAKIFAVFTFVLVICLVFKLEDILLHNAIYYLAGWNNPLYAAEEFKYSVFTMSNSQYIAFGAVTQLIGAFEIALVLVLLSALFPSAVSTAGVGILYCSGVVILSELADYTSPLLLLNPAYLFKNEELIKDFNVVNIFGTPVLSVFYIIFACAVKIALLIIAIHVVRRNKFRLNFIPVEKLLKTLRRKS